MQALMLGLHVYTIGHGYRKVNMTLCSNTMLYSSDKILEIRFHDNGNFVI